MASESKCKHESVVPGTVASGAVAPVQEAKASEEATQPTGLGKPGSMACATQPLPEDNVEPHLPVRCADIMPQLQPQVSIHERPVEMQQQPPRPHCQHKLTVCCCVLAVVAFLMLAIVFCANVFDGIQLSINIGPSGCGHGECHAQIPPGTTPQDNDDHRSSLCPSLSIEEHFAGGSDSATPRQATIEVTPHLSAPAHGECTVDGGSYYTALWTCSVVQQSPSSLAVHVGAATVLGQHHVRVTVTTDSCYGAQITIPIHSEHLGACFNRVQDFGETGIDCGGKCAQCEVDNNVRPTTALYG